MHVKNGITVALQVLPIFPLHEDHGKELFKVMEDLEKRTDLTPDLKQGCRAYMVQLQKRITVRPYLKAEDASNVCHSSIFWFYADHKNARGPTAASANARPPPSGPSRAAATNGGEESGSRSGKTSTPLAPAASAKLDQEALRQRVKESKAKSAAANTKEGRR
jgi:hypothetical protein